MHDVDLSAQGLFQARTDALRANARVGTTGILKLAHLQRCTARQLNSMARAGLFGLVHAHLACALSNTSYYEFFPGGSRDVRGREIGLQNPPLPEDGFIAPPQSAPDGAAEWDWEFFRKTRIGTL